MPKESIWDIQKAVYDSLSSDGVLTALLADGADSVFDHVPPGSAFPYIVIGEMSSRPLDTMGGHGRDVSVTIHSYSRGRGMKELKAIMCAVFEGLHDADFAIDGHDMISCRETVTDCFVEQDGDTRHGVQRFRIVTEASDA
jgi:hypothetical protein